MIDSLIVSPAVHTWVGVLVIAAAVVTAVVTGMQARKRQSVNKTTHLVMILAQVALMLQVLVGIKLLDQGLGALQLFIHYVGGLGAFFFFLLYYWLQPKTAPAQSRLAFILSFLALLFVLQTFFIGQAFVS